MDRREAREIVFALIYEMDFHQNDELNEIYQMAELFREFEGDDYIKEIYNGMPDKLYKIDALIDENSIGWKQNRISRTSLAIMRLCIYEMLYVESVPFNVAINEAIELAKKYDHEKAPAFINGILNAVAEKENLK